MNNLGSERKNPEHPIVIHIYINEEKFVDVLVDIFEKVTREAYGLVH